MSGFISILRGKEKKDIMNKDWLNVLVRGTNGEWEEQEDSRGGHCGCGLMRIGVGICFDLSECV